MIILEENFKWHLEAFASEENFKWHLEAFASELFIFTLGILEKSLHLSNCIRVYNTGHVLKTNKQNKTKRILNILSTTPKWRCYSTVSGTDQIRQPVPINGTVLLTPHRFEPNLNRLVICLRLNKLLKWRSLGVGQ